MAITSKVVYQGQLRTECVHVASGQVILTDAPTDNHGRGQAFSPTDLTATSLATCILTTVGIVIEQGRLPALQLEAEVIKRMSADAPRRIVRIEIDLHVRGAQLDAEQQARFERIAHTCPVALSLHPDIVQDVRFHYHA